MKIQSVRFLKSCPGPSSFPDYSFPEFAFFGRSNTGKSSLINMLMGMKDLVKTGKMPGVTKTVNFFILNENISIADLPGFGYAKLPAELKNKFLPLIYNYIGVRNNLRLAFLLIDIRRVPGDFEFDLLEKLSDNEINTAIVLTKCDKLSKMQRAASMKKIAAALEISENSVFFTSSKNGEGKKDLLSLMDEFS
jgi:GTP-binding protein